MTSIDKLFKFNEDDDKDEGLAMERIKEMTAGEVVNTKCFYKKYDDHFPMIDGYEFYKHPFTKKSESDYEFHIVFSDEVYRKTISPTPGKILKKYKDDDQLIIIDDTGFTIFIPKKVWEYFDVDSITKFLFVKQGLLRDYACFRCLYKDCGEEDKEFIHFDLDRRLERVKKFTQANFKNNMDLYPSSPEFSLKAFFIKESTVPDRIKLNELSFDLFKKETPVDREKLRKNIDKYVDQFSIQDIFDTSHYYTGYSYEYMEPRGAMRDRYETDEIEYTIE